MNVEEFIKIITEEFGFVKCEGRPYGYKLGSFITIWFDDDSLNSTFFGTRDWKSTPSDFEGFIEYLKENDKP